MVWTSSKPLFRRSAWMRGAVTGVETDIGMSVLGSAVVVTSGTFLRGLLHVGENSRPGGRMADTSSGLSESLRQLGFEVGRFKTGTPCRLSSRSIDFGRCEKQLGDDPPPQFSFLPLPEADANDVFTLNRGELFHMEQVACWITHTTAQTHEIIRQKSPSIAALFRKDRRNRTTLLPIDRGQDS